MFNFKKFMCIVIVLILFSLVGKLISNYLNLDKYFIGWFIGAIDSVIIYHQLNDKWW
jgi:hypothetical protein